MYILIKNLVVLVHIYVYTHVYNINCVGIIYVCTYNHINVYICCIGIVYTHTHTHTQNLYTHI
jgi:hypothetical protein